jgi:hypothetical protein
LVLVKQGRYYAVRAGEPSAYLARGEELLPLLPASAGPAVTGVLEDGDALLMCGRDCGLGRRESEVCDVLSHCFSPATAACRLEELAGAPADPPGVVVLYAGVGPALAAQIRGGWSQEAAAGPVEERTMHLVRAAARPAREWKVSGAALMALLALLAGMGGLSAGVLLSLFAGTGRTPAPPAAHGAPVPALRAELPAELVLVPPEREREREAAEKPRVEARPQGGGSVVAAPDQPLASVPPTARLQAPLSAPPVHALASGMSRQVQLRLVLDRRRSALVLTANQGTLFGSRGGQGCPAGEPLAIPVVPQLQSELQTAMAGLQIVTPDGTVAASLHSEELRRLLNGEGVAGLTLAPGDYSIVAGTGAGAPSGIVGVFRIAGW